LQQVIQVKVTDSEWKYIKQFAIKLLQTVYTQAVVPRGFDAASVNCVIPEDDIDCDLISVGE
jgi:hypothetical protein